MQTYTNELIHESSPYLLEHAHNPVNWHPWGEKALARAKQEDKLMIISIGYSSCHWCHVMERESYSDTEVAGVMNKYFIAIKVDREERPDIDQIYMNAAMLISGRGGWPLNAFALPDGRPFYAATYFPKDQWLEFLYQVENVYRTQKEALTEQAASLTGGINKYAIIQGPENTLGFDKESYDGIFKNWHPNIDFKWGGFSGAPKFPLPVCWEFLLQYFYNSKDDHGLKAVTNTLDKMAMGGIYDQIGGGFARYATDIYWKVPHFEKMLYDNGQLISLYAHAYQVTRNPVYCNVVIETLEFIKNEMTDPQGGFYSSINADSEGEEGKFYSWTYHEFAEILGPETSDTLSTFWNLTKQGNWENEQNILFTGEPEEDFAKRCGMTPEVFRQLVHVSREKLLSVRNNRIRPTTDTKILTSWNALMMKGYIDAYRALGNLYYLNEALKNAKFLEKNMIGYDHSLFRNFKDGKVTIHAFLDDYAQLSEAFIELYKVTFNIHWLHQAKSLVDFSIRHFSDDNSQLFFYTSNRSEKLISRQMELTDQVIPCSNSVMAHVLFMLGTYFDSQDYKNLSLEMLKRMADPILSGGPHYANWAIQYGLYAYNSFEIAILGDEATSKNAQMQKHFLPTCIFMGGVEENLPLLEAKIEEGRTKIYVCQNKTCKLPVEEVQTALDIINYG